MSFTPIFIFQIILKLNVCRHSSLLASSKT